MFLKIASYVLVSVIFAVHTLATEHCIVALGIEDGSVPDYKLSESSVASGYDHSAKSGRLNAIDNAQILNTGGWKPSSNDVNQWIQADLGVVKMVTGVITQGRDLWNEWVKSYKVRRSLNGYIFETVKTSSGQEEVFIANVDRATAVTNMFDMHVQAQFIRINPITWNWAIGLRFELLGCTVHVTTVATTDATTDITTEPADSTTDMTTDATNQYLIRFSMMIIREENRSTKYNVLRIVQTKSAIRCGRPCLKKPSCITIFYDNGECQLNGDDN